MNLGIQETSNSGNSGVGHALALITDVGLTDPSDTDWLIGQAILYVNTDDEEGTVAYSQLIEQLRERPEAVDTLMILIRRTPRRDVRMRCSMLQVLGALDDPTSAEFLAQVATQPLQPEDSNGRVREGELLVRTLAVEALLRVARRNPGASASILRIVAARPARPILIEALRAANDLGLNYRVRELLPRDYWSGGSTPSF